jgi:pyruvate/2-oxoglutarate/acetoin dehydrogenase E1 component
MSNYFDELKKSMEWLAEQENTIFLGQAVDYPGTALYNTLRDVKSEKKIEMPVAENMQFGISIGLSLQGFIPISVFPRWNFLLSATDQIVNHLDKIEEMSDGEFRPKVIIRVGCGSHTPLYPGPQHIGNFSSAFRLMCDNINIVELDDPQKIFQEYKIAFNNPGSSILVEYGDLY